MDEPMSGGTPETEPRARSAAEPGAAGERAVEAAEAVPGTDEPTGADRDRPAGGAEAEAGTEEPEGTAADDGPRPLGVSVAPTGHAGVDTRLRRLADADHLAVSDHLEVYEDVHRGLRDTLTALDRRSGPSAPGAPHDPGS